MVHVFYCSKTVVFVAELPGMPEIMVFVDGIFQMIRFMLLMLLIQIRPMLFTRPAVRTANVRTD